MRFCLPESRDVGESEFMDSTPYTFLPSGISGLRFIIYGTKLAEIGVTVPRQKGDRLSGAGRPGKASDAGT